MPNDISNTSVPLRLSSIIENSFFFFEGEDDHAASPHVLRSPPEGSDLQKQLPSRIRGTTSLSHDTGPTKASK
jgi:hypothetical protein